MEAMPIVAKTRALGKSATVSGAPGTRGNFACEPFHNRCRTVKSLIPLESAFTIESSVRVKREEPNEETFIVHGGARPEHGIRGVQLSRDLIPGQQHQRHRTEGRRR